MKRMNKKNIQQNVCRILTEEEVKERINNTPKINIEDLLQKGYVEANEFHRRLENGSLQ